MAAVLGHIPPRERLILRMRFVEDLTQTEIAERVGISQMQVSRLLRRSLDQLRTLTRADLSTSWAARSRSVRSQPIEHGSRIRSIARSMAELPNVRLSSQQARERPARTPGAERRS